MKRLTIVLTALILLAVMATSVAAAPTGLSGSPYFIVTRVDPDAYVYLRLYNFPQGIQVKVYQDLYGTMAVNGALVGGFGADSTTEFRVEMAKNIHGQARGAIRLVADGINISGYFLNVSGGSTTTGTSTGTTTTTTTIPTFSITSVVTDSKVSITTANFPANDTFNVLMNTMGTLGIGGTQVTSVSTGSGGTLSFTFDIPSNLYGLSRIAIRLESPTSGYFSYNWFNNNTGSGTTTSTGTGGPYETIPTFSITSVSRDNTVTIQTSSLVANFNYNVYMNTFGTAGIGGTLVTTVNSGAGGVQTFTFSIPSGLQGLDRIAIRMVSTTSGFFGYNWFWNNTYP
jgi:hypothetical protein